MLRAISFFFLHFFCPSTLFKIGWYNNERPFNTIIERPHFYYVVYKTLEPKSECENC